MEEKTTGLREKFMQKYGDKISNISTTSDLAKFYVDHVDDLDFSDAYSVYNYLSDCKKVYEPEWIKFGGEIEGKEVDEYYQRLTENALGIDSDDRMLTSSRDNARRYVRAIDRMSHNIYVKPQEKSCFVKFKNLIDEQTAHEWKAFYGVLNAGNYANTVNSKDKELSDFDKKIKEIRKIFLPRWKVIQENESIKLWIDTKLETQQEIALQLACFLDRKEKLPIANMQFIDKMKERFGKEYITESGEERDKQIAKFVKEILQDKDVVLNLSCLRDRSEVIEQDDYFELLKRWHERMEELNWTHFKISEGIARNDTITIYTNYKDAPEIIEFLTNLKNKNPELFVSESKPNPFVMKINGFISFAEYGHNKSFPDEISKILEKVNEHKQEVLNLPQKSRIDFVNGLILDVCAERLLGCDISPNPQNIASQYSQKGLTKQQMTKEEKESYAQCMIEEARTLKTKALNSENVKK